MPNKHFYFAMGALSGTTIIWVVRKTRFWLLKHTRWMKQLYRWDRHWFLYFPIVIGLFGLLAWTPDILHALDILPKSTTRNEFFNIFFFHSYFETLEDNNQKVDQVLNWIGEIILFCISLGILLFYSFQLKKMVRIEHRKRKKPNN